MGSSSRVDYSLRPNKTIQRRLVFEACRRLVATCGLRDVTFVGMGSVWFVDFVHAHVDLGIDRLISMERDPVDFRRARFTRPYDCIEVLNDPSSVGLARLARRPELRKSPWIVWLDYDDMLTEDKMADVGNVLHLAPDDSVLIVTVQADPKRYYKVQQRPERMVHLIGEATETLPEEEWKAPRFASTFLRQLANQMSSSARLDGRDHFVHAFGIAYADGAPMVTVGGMLCSERNEGMVRALVRRKDWEGHQRQPIAIRPLTIKEASTLRSALPGGKALRRRDVRGMGFDLTRDEIRTFEKYYKSYPSFVQIVG